MNQEFTSCRASTMSKLGRYTAMYFYPVVGFVLCLVVPILGIELYNSGNLLTINIIIYLTIIAIAIYCSVFFFKISLLCYRMETRKISINVKGFTIRKRTDIRYVWEAVHSIGIIAYAANASKQIYQTQICIFLEPISNVALRKLRDSYLYGAFNQNKYVLMDYDPLTLNKLKMCTNLSIEDLRSKQLKL